MRRIRSDMSDYDEMPLFFEMDLVDQEFYHDTPAPSEDIWKKFELLPTPPRSPRHESASTGSDSDDERLIAVTHLLDEPVSQIMIFPEKLEECCGNLKSKLIQDCMWSAPMTLGLSPETFKKTSAPKRNILPSNKDSSTQSVDVINSSECVDPAAVFPYPLSDGSSNVPASSSSTFDTPAVSSESENSDRDDDDDDDDDDDNDDDDNDDDDEEIDVVTVADKIQQSQINRRKQFLPAAHSMSAQVAAMHNYSSSAHSHSSSHITQSAPQSPLHTPSSGYKRSRPISDSMPTSPQPPAKRHRNIPSDLKRVVQKLSHHSHRGSSHHHRYNRSGNSSDSEDSEGKRAQHNVLERKRRNDLKSSFHTLRDHIPEIKTQERAPKVVILKKAADYCKQLRSMHRALNNEQEHQKHIHEQLKRKLSILRRDY